MPTTTKIFNAQTDPTAINKSDLFTYSSFLYLVAPDIVEEIEIDCFLNVFLNPGTQRIVNLGKKIIDTESIIEIPDKFRGSDLPLQIGLLVSTSETLELYSVGLECCLKKEMDELTKEVKAALIGKTISEIVSNPVAGTIGAVAKIIIPALAERGGFSIFNPSNETAYINFGEPGDTSSNNFAFPLNPGMYYVDDTGWDGNVSALTASGEEIALQVKHFLEAAPTP